MGSNPSLISIRLSAGREQPQATQALPPAAGTPLSPAEIEQILSRLPAFTAETAEQVDFKPAGDPLPPPRPGQTIQEPFPPQGEALQPTVVPAGPLEVLRFAPEGEIPIAPVVSITFNQPMTALATVTELAGQAVPAQIEPALPGHWRWQGTRTLTFEYDSGLIDRLPKATEFRVTIPAGTRSASGGMLAEAVSWTFSTPPPQLIAHYPLDVPQPQDPLFFAAFDQRIDPLAVLQTIKVTAGSQTFPLELATDEQIQASQEISRLVKDIPEGRWLAFFVTQLLPLDTTVSVMIGPGTPSAEGPLSTQEVQSFSFQTYAQLRVVEQNCHSAFDQCAPSQPFYIRFNNPLDLDQNAEFLARITPELPGAQIDISEDVLIIQGGSKGRTTYHVIVSKELQDVFGQKLGRDTDLNFTVGPAQPTLFGPQQDFVTLDPTAEKPTLSVYAMNYDRLEVKIYAVQPSDWPAYQLYRRTSARTDKPSQPPGRLVFDQTIPVKAPPDILQEVGIDLGPLMDGQYGHFCISVKPQGSKNSWQIVQAWVQVTQIGLDAFVDHSEMLAWATALKDGAPLADVSIQAGNSEILTGADGLARFPIPEGASYLVARKGQDRALLPRSTSYWSDETWYSQPERDSLRWYVFDDRQMYRPGEEVHVKGWLRRIGFGQTGDVVLLGDEAHSVRYTIVDSQGNEIGAGQVQVNALGGFDFMFAIPQSVNLGMARIDLDAEGAFTHLDLLPHQHTFQIQEFRRPEFEVTARAETAGPYFAGSQATVLTEAKYYAGGPLPNAEVTWQVASSPGSYAPPNWPDFTFGHWRPWWFERASFDLESFGGNIDSDTKYETFSGLTDAAGKHYLQLDFDASGEPQPVSITAEATVMDVNRQAWSSRANLLVHPADVYVGLRSLKYFVQRGSPLKIDWIVVDLDGNPVAGRPVEVRTARLAWKAHAGEWKEEEVDVQRCNLDSTFAPQTCTFETPIGGEYRITAQVTDELGRKNQSQFSRWVSGGQLPPARRVEQEDVTLIPDKESYRSGDVAQILVQAPFSPAEGLLTISRSGILYTRRFQIVEGTATLDIPIEEAYIPNLHVQVDLAGAAVRSDDQGDPLPDAPHRPAFASGSLNLSIPPLQRQLLVELIPGQSEVEPGSETTLQVQVKDAQGQPVAGAEVAVVVVDEAILALSDYQLQDPLAVFFAERESGVESMYGRASLVLADPQMLANTNQAAVPESRMLRSAEMAFMAMPAASPTEAPFPGTGGSDAASPAIRVRSDFNPLAMFAPLVATGPDGQASLPVQLPDNLTRYRIMAVAVQGDCQFGSAEVNLTARLPLMVRLSPPRFLNFGDQFELPVIVQNQTDQPLEVTVVAQAGNLELTGAAGLRLTAPARDRVELRFPARTVLAGTAIVRVAAVSGGYSDAATISLPVYTPATTEAFATYGVLDEEMLVQPVAAIQGVFPQYGGLEVNTSSTALQALTDAVLYLVQYPYDCTEQIASRLLAIAALRDVLTAFQAEGMPSPTELEAVVNTDIAMLVGLQNYDGGFPYWRRGADSIPFHTIHVAHALQRAKSKGFTVPAEMQSSVLDYLRRIESHYPAWYSQQTRWTLSAYAIYVRNLMGDRDPSKALQLIKEASLENLSLDAIGWLWPVLSDAPKASNQLEAIRRLVNNRIVETAGAANFTTSFDDQNYLLLGSNRRTDAILLDALIGDEPQHDLIPKLVNGLLAHRNKGRWDNTQENVFVLLAMDRYFNTYEAQTPDFVARIWLGDTYAGTQEFRQRSTTRFETDIPMSYLLDATFDDGPSQNLILTRNGTGRLYYRIGLRYAPLDLEQDALDRGFVVQRQYEAVDNLLDVSQDEVGVWHIKAGARVRVRLTMVADNRRYHVALVDPLPAGLEIVNPALAVSGQPPPEANPVERPYGWWWLGTWYEHQNMRDDRAEAFTSLLWDGVYEYTYIARATTPGMFVVPPARAEEMYSPEVFGRSASDRVIVE